jgi:hypothetical protein
MSCEMSLLDTKTVPQKVEVCDTGAQSSSSENEVSNMNISVLVDAKHEYSRQLVQLIRPHFLSGVMSIYEEAQSMCEEANEDDLCMLTFQELLCQVPKWNRMLVKEETARIAKLSECDWIDDLITAVFVCHTKILTTVRITNKSSKKINLQIPTLNDFIHQVYIELAREFWKHPYLISLHDTTKLQYQKNLAVADEKIETCIEATIRKMLPIKNILKEYLTNSDEYSSDTSMLDIDTVMSGSPMISKKEVGGSTIEKTDNSTVESNKSNGTEFSKAASNPDTKKMNGLGTMQLNKQNVTASNNTPPLLTPPKEFDDILAGLNIGNTNGDRSKKELAFNSISGLSSSLVNNIPQAGGGEKNHNTPGLGNVTKSSPSDISGSILGIGGGGGAAASSPSDISGSILGIGGGGGAAASSPSDISGSILGIGGGGGATAQSSADLSCSILGNLGGMEEVVVDFGGPRSAPPSPKIDSSVMSQFDKLGGSTNTTVTPSDTNKFSFF